MIAEIFSLSVCIEKTADPVSIGERVKRLIKWR
jgi:hypothetical protein